MTHIVRTLEEWQQQNIGAVAQSGERHVRNVEVRGSIPLGSTKPKNQCQRGYRAI